MRHRDTVSCFFGWHSLDHMWLIGLKLPTLYVVVISTRICFVEQPEESLGFFFVLGCFWESKKTIEARKQGRQKPAVCGTQKPSKNTGQYLQGCKTFDFTFLLFLSLFVNFLYKLGFVWVIPTSKWLEFTYFCKIGLGN